jgi:hypothetical protein
MHADIEFIQKTLAANPTLTKAHFIRKCSIPAKTVNYCEEVMGMVFGSPDQRNRANRAKLSKDRRLSL